MQLWLGLNLTKQILVLSKTNLENWNFPDTRVTNAAIWTNNESISFQCQRKYGQQN